MKCTAFAVQSRYCTCRREESPSTHSSSEFSCGIVGILLLLLDLSMCNICIFFPRDLICIKQHRTWAIGVHMHQVSVFFRFGSDSDSGRNAVKNPVMKHIISSQETRFCRGERRGDTCSLAHFSAAALLDNSNPPPSIFNLPPNRCSIQSK